MLLTFYASVQIVLNIRQNHAKGAWFSKKIAKKRKQKKNRGKIREDKLASFVVMHLNFKWTFVRLEYKFSWTTILQYKVIYCVDNCTIDGNDLKWFCTFEKKKITDTWVQWSLNLQRFFTNKELFYSGDPNNRHSKRLNHSNRGHITVWYSDHLLLRCLAPNVLVPITVWIWIVN